MLNISSSLPFRVGADFSARIPGLQEVFLQHQDTARLGRDDDEAVTSQAASAKEVGLRRVLVWDLPCENRDITVFKELIQRLGSDWFDAVITLDPGAASFCMQNLPEKSRYLDLRIGNHNLIGIQTWCERFQPECILISNEIPMPLLTEMRPHIPCRVAYPMFGKLVIFHSPRKLVSPVDPSHEDHDYLQRYITSVEDGKRFPLLENKHGTFMFYEKDLWLLPYLAEAEAAGVDTAFLDLSQFEGEAVVRALTDYLKQPDETSLAAVKQYLGPRLTRGFFKSNRTDKQFTRLNNEHILRRDEMTWVGTVLETKKKEYIAFESEGGFVVGDRLEIHTPDGKTLELDITWIKNSRGQKVEKADGPGLWLTNHTAKVSPKSRAYRRD